MQMLHDGNVILNFKGFPVRTTGTTNVGSRIRMEDDGNLVIWDKNNKKVWESGTTNNGSFVVVQNDANIAIYNDRGQETWSQRTVFSK